MRMHLLAALVTLAACAPRGQSMGEPAAAPAPRRPQTSPAREQPVAAAPEPDRCERTRAERVAAAKEAITTLHARVEALRPLGKWAAAHHCELKDTTGSVLVNRAKEAGGTRVSVKHGHPDELVCDTTKLPEGLDADVVREIAVYEQTDPNDFLFSTHAECDARESPSLRVRFNDTEGQRAILALP